LEDFKSGRRETFDLADGTRTNTTAQTIAEIERRKLNLQRVIAAYRDQLE